MDDTSLLYTLEAAEKAGLLEEKPREPEGRPRGPRHVQTHLFSPRQLLSFVDSNAETLAGSLEARMKREQLNVVGDLTLRVRGPLINILHLRNLLTRIAPDKTVKFRLEGGVVKHQSPQYTLRFVVSEGDAQSEEGRWLLDTAWRAKGCESMDVMLKLYWPEGTSAEAAARLVRGLGSEAEPFMASMDVNASRRSA